ncbi:uncharacterized protein LOC115806935 [Chanos chanos]|uniref:DNA (cytosine-5-)-methyltransferase n=1 Tax=Chanos chanos TaxID=29144 RepID=A0A6J2UWF0_CHACN|nr:uncharacterized protein LOC115806935 [Chanos chanos]
MVFEVKVRRNERQNQYKLLAWLNKVLQSNFTEVEHTYSGAAYCQLMDLICPGSVDLKEVKFKVEDNLDVLHNYKLLQDAFRKAEISNVLPIEGLIQGNFQDVFFLLKWFKAFYDRNFAGQMYNPLEARTKAVENLKGLEDVTDTQADQNRADIDIMMEQEAMDSFTCGLATLQFISKFWLGASASTSPLASYRRAKHLLSQTYCDDIKAASVHTPYCLYIYPGVELGNGLKGSVLLIGHFNPGSGAHCIRLLDVIQPKTETDAAELECVVVTLRDFEIPLTNLSMFYVNAMIPEQSQALVCGLRNLKPGVVSLCGLLDIAAQACQAGVMATGVSEQIHKVVNKVHHHYSSCTVAKNSLQELFDEIETPLNVINLRPSQYPLFIRIVHKMAIAWTDLTQYFGSFSDSEDVKAVSSLFGDQQLRLTFLFLSFALQPLSDLQENLDKMADLGQVLQDACGLIQFHVSSFLCPPAVEHFLRRGNTSLFKDKKQYLPKGELKVGTMVEEFLSELKEDMTGYLDIFHESVISFHSAVASSIIENLPLPYMAVQNMAAILSRTGKLKVTGKAVADIGLQLGICQSQAEVSQLMDEFLEYQLSEREEHISGSRNISVEQYWKRELKIMGKTSIFRKLVQSLLTLPRTLAMEEVFSQAFENSSCYLESSLPEKVMEVTEEQDMHMQDEKEFSVGELVWGQVEGFSIWPGVVQNWERRRATDSICKVMWFGDGMYSEISSKGLLPFADFAECFCNISFGTHSTYKDAIFQSLQVAASRCGKAFSLETDCRDELLRVMLDWALEGFKPTGPEGFRPQANRDESEELFRPVSNKRSKLRVNSNQKLVPKKQNPPISMSTFLTDKTSAETVLKLKQVSVCLKKLSLDLYNGCVDLKDDSVSRKLGLPKWKNVFTDVVKKSVRNENPTSKRQKYGNRSRDESKEQSMIEQKQEHDFNRERMVHKVLIQGESIEDFCLSCGTVEINIFHPLFEGSLCLKCKDNFTETLYRYDEDGYQSYCTVCCAGLEVILCGNESCSRSYCVDCLNILVGAGTFDRLKEVDPWICYLCEPERGHGALRPRHDWSIRVQEFFANNSAMEFEPHRVYPSIPANLRRPIRVLSLFDGISTGYLVLRDLGFKVEKYVASEIDEDSITVSMVNHYGKILHVDDVRFITKEHIDKWGPFDLLIGGSPCNDLSIVNPARKGLFEGTGRLFFEFYRLLNVMKPKDGDPHPFFWLFENVVFMASRDKADICRFLECNPVLIDAVKVSPAHRARYFWGNLPGMNRPIIASQNDKLTLQDCLEVGRMAKFNKVRTITTRTNSLKQGTTEVFPVTMNKKDDNIWVTELEKIFGFPKHYTDVRNMGRIQRQKVLGKSWSVPVIRHLFAPLKDYFACDEVPLK